MESLDDMAYPDSTTWDDLAVENEGLRVTTDHLVHTLAIAEYVGKLLRNLGEVSSQIEDDFSAAVGIQEQVSD